MKTQQWMSAVIWILGLTASCGNEDPGNTSTNGGMGGSLQSGGEAGSAVGGNGEQNIGGAIASGGNAGTSGTSGADGGTSNNAACPSGCDDGFSCTLDSCSDGDCVHTIGPNEGQTACPTGEYCTLRDGCVKAPACETDDDCERAWSDDPCKTATRCDEVSSTCGFRLLDKDSDGHAPQVCGGDDCDDSDSFRYPGNIFGICDGLDNDCNGVIDDENLRSSCYDPLTSCREGSCMCNPSLTECDGFCVDTMTDAAYCGKCSVQCDIGQECVAGNCQCASGTAQCEQRSVLDHRPLICGIAEGLPCDATNGASCCPGSICEGGVCSSCTTKLGTACEADEDCCVLNSGLGCGYLTDICGIPLGESCDPAASINHCISGVCSLFLERCCLPSGSTTSTISGCCSGATIGDGTICQ